MTEYQDYGFQDAEASHVFNYLQAPLLNMLNKERNTCILDLGCGNGYLANYLLTMGFNIYGTDASVKGIAIASQVAPGRFFVQDLSTDELPAPLRGLKFDTIITTEVIEHLYNPVHFIDFCKQILTDQGEIIISTPYHGYLKNLMLSVMNKWDTHASPLWIGGHIKLWSKHTLSHLLTDAGFTVTSFEGCGRIPYLWKSMIIKARLN
jgi:2-polyprenyl-3-methyl-5-hydroxy-6-metoxy-1,4-benzoquinol methylase